MAITLVTGKPGAGKTLFFIDVILAESKKDDREVYVCNLNGLLLQHKILEDARNWVEDLPDGCLCLIDEAQEFWPNLGGFKVPDEVRALEKHRHRGIDFFMATQHPNQIPKHIRNLCEQHIHLHRPMGARFHYRYTYESVMENPASAANHRYASNKDKWFFKKPYYSMYKSTIKDTYKFRMPKQVYWIVPILIGGLALGYHTLTKRFSTSSPENQIEKNEQQNSTLPAAISTASFIPTVNPLGVSGDWFISSVFCFSFCKAEFNDVKTGRIYDSDYLSRVGYSLFFYQDYRSVEIFNQKTKVATLFYFRPENISNPKDEEESDFGTEHK